LMVWECRPSPRWVANNRNKHNYYGIGLKSNIQAKRHPITALTHSFEMISRLFIEALPGTTAHGAQKGEGIFEI